MSVHIHLSILISFTSDYPSLSLRTYLSSLISFTSDTIRLCHCTSTSVASSHSLQILSVFVTPHKDLSILISFTSDTIRLCHSAHRPQYPHLIHFRYYPSLSRTSTSVSSSHSLQTLSVDVTPHIHLSILISFTSDTIRLCHSAQRPQYPHLIHFRYYPSLSLHIDLSSLISFTSDTIRLCHWHIDLSSLISFTSDTIRLCHWSTKTSVASSHSLQILSVFVTPHIHLSSLISFTSDTIRLCEHKDLSILISFTSDDYPSLSLHTWTSVSSSHSLQTL